MTNATTPTVAAALPGSNVYIPDILTVFLAVPRNRSSKTYTVYANVDQRDFSEVSRHRSLKAAGKSYQSAHTGNLRRVLDQDGNNVTSEACDAANGF